MNSSLRCHFSSLPTVLTLVLLPVLGSSLLLPDEARSGPNSGGVLVLHTRAGINPTCDPIQYCGLSNLTQCENADTRSDEACLYFYAIAAFPNGSTPRLGGVTFGLDYDDSDAGCDFWWFGSCADGIEEADLGWPASGTGTRVSWRTPATTQLTEVYYFLGYQYYGSTNQFRATPHPLSGGLFFDDSSPAVTDTIVDYGIFGFGTDGYLPCPAGR